MDTKRNTILPVLEKCPPIFTSAENVGFTGAYPPTGEQILLHFQGYHRYLQDVNNRQSTVKDAIKLVIKDTVDWWEKSGIPLKTYQALEKMIQNLLNEFNLRKKHVKRCSAAEEKRRKQ